MEQKDNPLVSISFHFQDGVALQWKPGAPIPQVEVMRSWGEMAARVNLPLDIELEDVPVAIARDVAQELVDACKALHNGVDILFARLAGKDPGFYPSKSGIPWAAIVKGNEARAKLAALGITPSAGG